MKKVNRRAQSSMEFVILVSAVLFFFVALLFVFQQTLSSKLLQQRDTEFLELAKTVQNEIALAAGTSDGYQRNFFIPDKILGVDYTIIVQEGIIYISSEDGKHALALPTFEVNGQIAKGNNFIRKENGEVLLN